MITRVIWCLILVYACIIGSACAQVCGTPPGPFHYSDNFYRAEAKYLQSNSNTSEGANVKYGDLAISGDSNKTDNVTNWQTLTLQQAHDIIVQEHANQAANIIAECGYRACLLQGGNLVSPSTQTLLSDVCAPAIAPTSGSGPNASVSVSPTNTTVIFGAAEQQKRTVTITNSLPANLRVTWTVDPGANAPAYDLLVPELQKILFIPSKKSITVNVALHRPATSDVQNLIFTIQAADDATVKASSRFTLIGDARLLLPSPAIASGQLYPNAKEWNDQDNPNPVFTAPPDSGPYDYPLPHPLMGPWMCNTHGTNACGKAQYTWSFNSPTVEASHASALMRIDADVGGKCGNAWTSAPGGYGGVDPRWVTTLSLPGISKQDTWNVKITTDILHTVPHASCKLTIGSDINSVSNDNVTALEKSLAPGAYVLELSCEGDNPYYGCKGAPGLAHYVGQHYQVGIDADRVSRVQPRTDH